MIRTSFLLAAAVITFLPWEPTVAQRTPPMEFDEPGIPDTHWPRIYFRAFDKTVKSAGLEPLRSKQLAPGTREVRVWLNETLFRLVDEDGSVDGDIFYSWSTRFRESEKPGETFHELMIYYFAGSCEEFNDVEDRGNCRALFAQPPDWSDALQRAEEARLWELPDSSELPPPSTFTLHGWSITVELHDGNAYRTYHYNNPQHRHEWPEAKYAVEIASIFREIEQFIQRADSVNTYRGVMRDLHDGILSVCGNQEKLGLQFDLNYLLLQAGLIAPPPGPYGFLVEMAAKPTPEWLAREWKSEFRVILQSAELESIAPAMSPTCD